MSNLSLINNNNIPSQGMPMTSIKKNLKTPMEKKRILRDITNQTPNGANGASSMGKKNLINKNTILKTNNVKNNIKTSIKKSTNLKKSTTLSNEYIIPSNAKECIEYMPPKSSLKDLEYKRNDELDHEEFTRPISTIYYYKGKKKTNTIPVFEKEILPIELPSIEFDFNSLDFDF